MSFPPNPCLKYKPRWFHDKKKRSRGVVVTVYLPSGNVRYGWSLCDRHDRWSRMLALQIAVGRAVLGFDEGVPHSIMATLQAAKLYHETSAQRKANWLARKNAEVSIETV